MSSTASTGYRWGPFIIIPIAEDLMTREELVLPGEFIGAILFTIVLPLVAAIAVAVNYLRHVG